MLETSVLLGYVGFEAVLGLLLVNIIIYSVYFAETAQWNFVSISNNVCYLYLTLLILLLYCFFDSTNTNILNHGLQQCVNSHFFAILSIFSSILSLLFLSFYLKKTHFYKHEYITVCLLSIIGMVILSKSTGFINIYLGLELQSIAFYVLATFFLNSKFSVESGIKYFITGSFISCVLLFSFALLYLVTGSLDLECYQNVLVFEYYNLNISLISVVFIIFCLLFKIGCFPFHYILCDVYEGTLITTTLFFSIVPKAVILYVITKLLLVSFINYNAAVQNVLMFLAILSILFTSVNALFQKRIKRLLALSTVAHSGFMLLGVACFSIESIKAIVFYVIPYIVMSFTVFAIIGTSLSRYGFLKYIINWLSFSNKNLLISVMLTICLFSLAGIPPFIGFYSKMLVFIALIKDQHIAVSLIVALLSCLSCFYYIRLIKVLFFQNNGSNVQWIILDHRLLEIAITSSCIILALFILTPNPLIAVSFGISELFLLT